MLDPLSISAHFVSTVLDYGVFGWESIWQSLQRAAKPEVLAHTSVYAGVSGKMFRIRSAALRRRPNGEDIRCCSQVAKYVKGMAGRVLFRCRQRSHVGSRLFTVRLLLPEDGKRWIYESGGHHRYIVDALDSDEF